MGYYSSVTGKIRIEPPLTHAEISQNPDWFKEDAYGGVEGVDGDISFEVTTGSRETGEGTLTFKQAHSIIPWTDDSSKYYTLSESVQKLVSTYPNHEYRGHLHIEGEDNDDIWRIYIRDGKVVEVRAELKWPEGYED